MIKKKENSENRLQIDADVDPGIDVAGMYFEQLI